ncbi:uncharacterized protein LOC131168913 [Hevea brasiliensis]|uniref:uncharacterized protein LOC131168913 n=1 Tax=Hevea brasiliensis TaxID=3981 RepID=UPI0025D137AD|nr:uncharacterized protein LOC131168913 [Hevea brasiliensis]
MEKGESVLEAISEVDEVAEDVEMVDVEEGELLELNPQIGQGQSSGGGGVCDTIGIHALHSKNRGRRENKKKNRKKRGSLGPNVTDINRFVVDTCRRLKEKKLLHGVSGDDSDLTPPNIAFFSHPMTIFLETNHSFLLVWTSICYWVPDRKGGCNSVL